MEKSKKLGLWLPEKSDPLEVSKVSENFRALDDWAADAGSPYKVGDIRLTQRTDLGDDWLLCNGEPFDVSEYPELAEQMPGLSMAVNMAALDKVWTPPSTPSGYRYATDGVNQVMAYAGSSGYLLWSSDNFKTHTETGSGAGVCFPFFANGYWIFFRYYRAYDSYTGGYMANAFVVASSEFGKIQSWRSLSILPSSVSHVEYIDGKYYAFCLVGGRSAVLVSETPDFALITEHYVNTAKVDSAQSFLRADGKFVFIRYYGSAIFDVTWSDQPDAGYQTRTPANNTGQTGSIAPRSFQGYVQPVYQDGKIFWADGATIDSKKRILIPYLEGVETGGLNYVDLMDAPASDTVDAKTTGILQTGKEYAIFWCDIASKKYWLLTGTNLLDPNTWTKYILSPSYATGGTLSCLYAQYIYNGILSAFTQSSYVLTVPTVALPRIEVDNCYAYVKAK